METICTSQAFFILTTWPSDHGLDQISSVMDDDDFEFVAFSCGMVQYFYYRFATIASIYTEDHRSILETSRNMIQEVAI